MVLGNLSVLRRPTLWMILERGPIALAIGAGGGCLDIFTILYPFSPISSSLWETARYRVKNCLKGPLDRKQPTNQHTETCPWILSFWSSQNFVIESFVSCYLLAEVSARGTG